MTSISAAEIFFSHNEKYEAVNVISVVSQSQGPIDHILTSRDEINHFEPSIRKAKVKGAVI